MSWLRESALFRVPAPLSDALSVTFDVTSLAAAGLAATQDALGSLSSAGLDAEDRALTAAIQVARDAVAPLLSSAGLYVLLVPVRRAPPRPALIAQTLADLGLPDLPAAPTSEAKFIGANDVVPDVNSLPAGAADLLVRSFRGGGGNRGFLKTVIESLEDAGDDSRPQLAGDQHVAGFTLLAGATNYAALAGLASALDAALGAALPVEVLVPPVLPAPSHLRATQGVHDGAVVTVLTWDPIVGVIPLSALGTSAAVSQYAVLRSTDPSLLTRRSLQEAVGLEDVRKGQSRRGVQVVDVVDVDPAQAMFSPRSSYVDTTPLPAGARYYYAVAYNVRLGAPDELSFGGGTPVGLAAARLSGVATTYRTGRAARVAKSTAPDWRRTPSALDVVPSVGALVEELTTYLDDLDPAASSYAALLRGQIEALQAEVQDGSDRAQAFSDALAAADQLSRLPAGAGLYVRGFSTTDADVSQGLGGTKFLVSDLTRALSDASDVNRPPFDEDEFVVGAVVLASAPSAAALDPVLASLSLVFNFAARGSAASIARESLQNLARAVTQVTLVDNFTPVANTVAGTPVPSMTPVALGDADPGFGKAPAPAPTLGKNLKPSLE